VSEQTDTLEKQILEDARRQAEPILRRARREAKEVLRRAEEEAARRRSEVCDRAARKAEAEAERLRARAELEAENIRRRAREEILRQVRNQAVEALRAVTGTARYEEILVRLGLAALEAMSGRRFELVMREQDRDACGERVARILRERAATELGKQIIVTVADETAVGIGGLVVRRADGHQVCDQTFEARLDRLWDQLRVEVAGVLFGEPESPDEGCATPGTRQANMTDDTDTALESGVVDRVAGPIVEALGMEGAQMYEVVEVGPHGLVGEVIKLDGERATIQVYEHTGGLKPGVKVRRTGGPLSLKLGPGLLGSIYDGVQHPLEVFARATGAFITRGAKAFPLDQHRQWPFQPAVAVGERVEPGRVFGKVPETASIEHRLLVPPRLAGTVRRIEEAGRYRALDTVCVIESEDGTHHELTMVQQWPCRRPRPFRRRLPASRPLITGQRVLDTLFPLARGGAAAIPGDFGTGKTIVQQQLAKWSDADVVVYVGCGERGNEMADVLRQFPKLEDPRTGRSLMDRTVLIANTSNMPVAAREVSIYTGVTVAEYYRDMGYDVALMADSTSRWAEALREVGSRLEQMPAEEGFPAYLSARLAQFYERAGPVETLGGAEGSVTIVGAVSPPGGDFGEPVTQHTTRFTRCFWVLDRELAYARHFPAVSWDQSYSEYVRAVAQWWEEIEPEWTELRMEAANVLRQYGQLQEIVKLVGPDVLPDAQRLVLLTAQILKQGFLQQHAFDEVDSFCAPAKQAALLRAIVTFHRRARDLIARGAPLMRIRELEIVQKLRRARFNIRNDDREALGGLLQDLATQLEQVEANHR